MLNSGAQAVFGLGHFKEDEGIPDAMNFVDAMGEGWMWIIRCNSR